MTQKLLSGFPSQLRNRSCVFLAFFWLAGFAAGLLVYLSASGALFPLMHGIPDAPVSIVGSQLVFLLPFLFSAFAVIFHTPIWIFPIAYGKAFLLAIVSIGLIDSMGSAGWLYQVILLLGDWLTLPGLYLFWLRSLSEEQRFGAVSVLCLIAGAFLGVCVNIRFVSPFFAEIGNR